MFHRLTVAGKLGLGFGFLLSLMVLISLVGNFRVGFMDRTLHEVREGAAVKQRHAINFRGSVHDRAIAIRDAVLVRNDRALEGHLRDVERLDAFYQDSAVAMDRLLDELGATDREARLLADIQDIQTRYPRSVMGVLKETTGRLAATMTRVRQASTQLAEASAELLGTADNNREQIRLQSEEAQQMAAAVNQMAATVNEVAGFAANAASATRTADEEVEKGNRVVGDTATAIGNLADTLEGATVTVKQVSQDSANIETIIEVINGIAEQTNLLALNAAIEAARAGTHGRGFAVVADEVRSLATRTQDSTREIQEMIGKLQTGAGQAVAAMETSRERARETVVQTGEARDALARIRHEVGAINDMNAQIASAAEEQSSVAEEVNRNISRIHDATVETAAGSEQVASSSRELDTVADQLRSEVSFFRIRDRA